MEEQNTDFLQEMEQLLDAHDYAEPKVGDIRTGVIVSISPQGVIVDLGLKRDGIIQTSDLAKLPQEARDAMQVNDDLSVYVQVTDQPDSLIVSRYMAVLNQDWIRAQEYLDDGEIIEAEVLNYNRGGILAKFGELQGFIPSSHLTVIGPGLNDRLRQQRLSKLRGERIWVKVIEVDRRRKRLVLSQRDADKIVQVQRRKELMETLEEGAELTGHISGWRDFGAFVDLGDGINGLIHVSELAWHRVNHPREVVKIGEEVQISVLKVDKESERISLSRKKMLPNPWSFVEEKYEIGTLVEGRVIRIVNYGAFVELEPGVEGLLHLSQMSRGNPKDPREVVNDDEIHLLRIISIDGKRQRIGLSLRQVTAKEQIEWMTRVEAEASEEDTAEAEESTEVVADEASSTVEEADSTDVEAPTDTEASADEAEVEEASTEEPSSNDEAIEASEDNSEAETSNDEASDEATSDEETSDEETSGEDTTDEDSSGEEADGGEETAATEEETSGNEAEAE